MEGGKLSEKSCDLIGQIVNDFYDRKQMSNAYKQLNGGNINLLGGEKIVGKRIVEINSSESNYIFLNGGDSSHEDKKKTELSEDEDNDDIWNSDDLCFDTVESRPVDKNGCSDYQKDDDDDGYSNAIDDCINTPSGEIVNSRGCSLSQIDTDNDGVNDAEDAFPTDQNESIDTDSDGVADRWDDYPEDPTRSESTTDESGNGMIYALLIIIILGIVGALLVVKNRQVNTQQNSLFAQQMSYESNSDESNLEQKDIPNIENTQAAPNTWEENGVHWTRDSEGNLSYYDQETQAWKPYNLMN